MPHTLEAIHPSLANLTTYSKLIEKIRSELEAGTRGWANDALWRVKGVFYNSVAFVVELYLV